jgi:hypothetical protein
MNRRAGIAIAISLLATPAAAMRFYAAPPFLHLTGRVVSDDWEMWKSALRTFEDQLKVVVFHDSPGGLALTGRRIGPAIRAAGMRTVVAGRCMSACANMFLGGVERSFASTLRARPTVVGYHGSYSGNSGAVKWDFDASYYVELTGGKMDAAFVESFARLESNNGALYFIHPAQRESDSKALAYLCKGNEQQFARDTECTPLAAVDGLQKGIFTTWDAVVVPAVPSRFIESPARKNW